jgi:hypothetical protein
MNPAWSNGSILSSNCFVGMKFDRLSFHSNRTSLPIFAESRRNVMRSCCASRPTTYRLVVSVISNTGLLGTGPCPFSHFFGPVDAVGIEADHVIIFSIAARTSQIFQSQDTSDDRMTLDSRPGVFLFSRCYRGPRVAVVWLAPLNVAVVLTSTIPTVGMLMSWLCSCGTAWMLPVSTGVAAGRALAVGRKRAGEKVVAIW